jgi:hypothetical protein
MALMAESGYLEQVDRGADNPTSYYTNYHETRKIGQDPVWAVAPLIIIIIIIIINVYEFEERSTFALYWILEYGRLSCQEIDFVLVVKNG